VILLERGLYTPDQIGRRTPETQDLSIDQVRTLILARAAYPPHEGRARVYIVRRAEELSTAAANALLKTLEEPGDKTHFVLLSSRAGSLLPTILSRTLRVRFGPLPDAVVTDLLVREGLAASDARAVATLARGSMTVAAALGDPESTAARQAFVDKALLALRSKGIGPALEVAEEAKKQKGDLDVHLAALLRRLAEDSLARASEPGGGARRARQCSVALEAMEELDGNANAQLVVESMLLRMRSV
jgi:DNA polymerase-3 subunit delta'